MAGENKSNQSVDFARALVDEGAVVKAVTVLIDCIQKDQYNHEAFCFLGDIYAGAGKPLQAVENYGRAVMLLPTQREYKQKLVFNASALTFRKAPETTKALLIECLDSEDIELVHFGKAWLSILASDASFSPLYRLSKHSNYNSFKRSISEFSNLDDLIDPFFMIGLGKFIVADPDFERWCTYLRRYLLESVVAGKTLFSDGEDIDLISCALLKYCYFTDYIFFVTPEEQGGVDFLKDEVAQHNSPVLPHLALLGCYEPLALLPNAKEIASNLEGGDHVSQIPKSQIEDYFAQQEIRKNIKVLTKIEDDISKSVRAQYEEFPYPRWAVASQDLFNGRTEGVLKGQKSRVLIAGCGTGKEAVQMAYALPDVQIIAVDLSKTSLAYAIYKTTQLGIKNITYMQGDIMQLGNVFEEKFDYIASAGVLHHMKDPKAGWKVLNNLLKPKGLMRIALYSSHSRWAVNHARGVIARENIGGDVQSIRDFREKIAQYLKFKYIKNIQNFYDYYSLPECRDLLFHVQERDYNLLEIKEILDEFGLEFLEFQIQDSVLTKYKKRNPDDPAARDLMKWAAWQDKHPETVLPMHTFWCQKR